MRTKSCCWHASFDCSIISQLSRWFNTQTPWSCNRASLHFVNEWGAKTRPKQSFKRWTQSITKQKAIIQFGLLSQLGCIWSVQLYTVNIMWNHHSKLLLEKAREGHASWLLGVLKPERLYHAHPGRNTAHHEWIQQEKYSWHDQVRDRKMKASIASSWIPKSSISWGATTTSQTEWGG